MSGVQRWSRSLFGRVCRRAVPRKLFAADDGQVHADLHRHRLAADLDRRLAVEVPTERAGREFLDLGDEWHVVDDHRNRLGVAAKVGPADGASGFLGHESSLLESRGLPWESPHAAASYHVPVGRPQALFAYNGQIRLLLRTLPFQLWVPG